MVLHRRRSEETPKRRVIQHESQKRVFKDIRTIRLKQAVIVNRMNECLSAIRKFGGKAEQEGLLNGSFLNTRIPVGLASWVDHMKNS